MAVPDNPFHYITATYDNGAEVYDIKDNKKMWMGMLAENTPDLYRGNTNLVRLDADRYITITHKLTHDEYGRKRYLNYFVLYDNALVPVKISEPFKTTPYNIEFITTLLLRGDDIIIGTTEMDSKPMVQTYDRRELLDTLLS